MSTRVASKVVGMTAGGREHIVASVELNDPVLIVPEPTNPYDRHAVAVYTGSRRLLYRPVVSCFKDPLGVGEISEQDTAILMDRQAGYLPAPFAATLDLPDFGLVGYVSEVRWAPPEFDLMGNKLEARVAGFDVTANFQRWRTREGVAR